MFYPRFTLLLLSLVAGLAGCQDETVPSVGEGMGPVNRQIGNAFGSGNSNANGQQNGFGQGALFSDGNLDIDYPVSTYAGAGNMYSITRDNPIKQTIVSALSDKEIVSRIDRYWADFDKINEETSKAVGRTTYTRVPYEEVKQLGPEERYPSFLVFTNRAQTTNRGGSSTMTFDPPLPVLIMPATMTRYEPLTRGSLMFRSRVTHSSRGTWNATYTYRQVSRSGNQIKIRLDVMLDDTSNERGQRYEVMPNHRSMVYTIDTQNRLIVDIFANYSYWHSNQRTTRDTPDNSIQYRLCKYERGQQPPKIMNQGWCNQNMR